MHSALFCSSQGTRVIQSLPGKNNMLFKKEQKTVGLQDSENYLDMIPGDSPSFQKVSQQGPLPEKSLKDLLRINKG